MAILKKVSVVIPSNKPLNQITKISYKFIVQQTYRNIELLIYLNGINKKERKLVINYFEKLNIYNHKIICFYSKKQITPGLARLKLINESSGEYIIFIDADDIPDINLISYKMNFANKENSDIVCSSANIFSNIKEYKYEKMKIRSYFIKLMFLTLFRRSFLPLTINLMPNSGTLVKKNLSNKSILENYPNYKHEDFIFYLSLINNIKTISIIEKPLISYYVSRKTMTGNKLLSRIWHAKAVTYYKKIPLFYSILLTLFGVLFSQPLIFLFENARLFFMKSDTKNNKFSFLLKD